MGAAIPIRLTVNGVRSGKNLPRRLAAQHEGSVAGVDAVGGIGLTALELTDGEQAAKPVDMIGQPAAQRLFVEAKPLAYLACAGIRLSPVHIRRLSGEPVGCQRVALIWYG